MTETERRQCVKNLHKGVIENAADAEDLLWNVVMAYQNHIFYTLSGLEFSYEVKRKRNGEYSGELLVSRKETSKTLTRSSIMLAFRRIMEGIKIVKDEENTSLIVPEYRGPKAIGQIFGISYIYSMFIEFELIKKAEKAGKK